MRHSAKLGLMSMAAALISGAAKGADFNIYIPEGYRSEDVGVALKYQLENKYKTAASNKPSRAAHYKRLAKKRRNIRARSKK